MLNLILAIASSALVAVMMRASERHGKGRTAMLAVNYLICTGLAACFTTLGQAEGVGTAVLLGAVSGVLYLGSFLMLQWCVGRSGVIMSSTFMKLGVLVSALMSVVFFGETPRVTQLLGLVLTVAAITMMNLSKGASRVTGLGGLVLLMVCGGITDGMSKVYEQLGAPEWQGVFLLVTFAVALVLCVGLTALRHEKPTKYDLMDGALIGIPNYFSALFLLQALDTVPAVVAFPTYSVATIAVVSLVGVAAFRERLTARQWTAMGVIAAALVLLNV